METLERTCRAGCVIRQLYIAAGHNFFGHHGQLPGENSIVEVPEVECVAGCGLRGDRFFDFKENYKGQITFFAWETYDAICCELVVRNRMPSVFRRNVITTGADLNELSAGSFRFKGCVSVARKNAGRATGWIKRLRPARTNF
jgi:hypothetical protein